VFVVGDHVAPDAVARAQAPNGDAHAHVMRHCDTGHARVAPIDLDSDEKSITVPGPTMLAFVADSPTTMPTGPCPPLGAVIVCPFKLSVTLLAAIPRHGCPSTPVTSASNRYVPVVVMSWQLVTLVTLAAAGAGNPTATPRRKAGVVYARFRTKRETTYLTRLRGRGARQ
jgi:hypothetical protein